jgi:hypothetical protein
MTASAPSTMSPKKVRPLRCTKSPPSKKHLTFLSNVVAYTCRHSSTEDRHLGQPPTSQYWQPRPGDQCFGRQRFSDGCRDWQSACGNCANSPDVSAGRQAQRFGDGCGDWQSACGNCGNSPGVSAGRQPQRFGEGCRNWQSACGNCGNSPDVSAGRQPRQRRSAMSAFSPMRAPSRACRSGPAALPASNAAAPAAGRGR